MKTMHMLMVSAILSLVLLTGCVQDSVTPPPSTFLDRSMVDYSFIDISNSCQLYSNINISYYSSNISDTPCESPKQEFLMFYTEENNWSIMCCEYESKCVSDSTNVSDYNDICLNANDGEYTGYVFNDDGFWMAQCCNEDGSSCYVDLSINTSDDTTVCDDEYHENTYSIDYNGTMWNAMCCIGGLEE